MEDGGWKMENQERFSGGFKQEVTEVTEKWRRQPASAGNSSSSSSSKFQVPNSAAAPTPDLTLTPTPDPSSYCRGHTRKRIHPRSQPQGKLQRYQRVLPPLHRRIIALDATARTDKSSRPFRNRLLARGTTRDQAGRNQDDPQTANTARRFHNYDSTARRFHFVCTAHSTVIFAV
jgi:hypothetical protein